MLTRLGLQNFTRYFEEVLKFVEDVNKELNIKFDKIMIINVTLEDKYFNITYLRELSHRDNETLDFDTKYFGEFIQVPFWGNTLMNAKEYLKNSKLRELAFATKQKIQSTENFIQYYTNSIEDSRLTEIESKRLIEGFEQKLAELKLEYAKLTDQGIEPKLF